MEYYKKVDKSMSRYGIAATLIGELIQIKGY